MTRAWPLLIALAGCATTCPPPAPPPAVVTMPVTQELLERLNRVLELEREASP